MDIPFVYFNAININLIKKKKKKSLYWNKILPQIHFHKLGQWYIYCL